MNTDLETHPNTAAADIEPMLAARQGNVAVNLLGATPDQMVEVARKYDALVAIDCVTSLGGVPLDIDALGVDAAGSCSQKCIGAPPGLGPITIGPRAMTAVRARKHKPSTWYFDLALLFQYWGEDGAHRTRGDLPAGRDNLRLGSFRG